VLHHKFSNEEIIVIAKVLVLQKDGTEQPQFFELAVKYDGVGAPGQTVVYGTEENLRELLRDGGMAGIDIDALFKSVSENRHSRLTDG
jgi:hypothetical protein